MRLKEINTTAFRNLAGGTLALSDGINLLYGSNAAGKTNTLECAYVFASGRSFRTRHEAELIQKGSDTARAGITLERSGLTENMSVVWHLSKEKGFVKRMTYQGYEVGKVSEFLGVFRAVLFTPDHLMLIKGSPEERRRFLDMALSQLQPRYIHYMNSYLKLLADKNSYLKKISPYGRADEDYLEVLNSMLAKTAAVVIKQRSGLADMLREYAMDAYGELSGSKETLDVRYISSTKENFSDMEYTERRLLETYRADLPSEIKQGRTLHGPHKDDVVMYIKNSPMLSERDTEEVLSEDEVMPDGSENTRLSEFAARTFGSQGQQRSAVLAVKIAEGEIFNKITGEYPVFLLDDLLGELDNDRRSYLIKLIRDRQALITCCDLASFPNYGEVNLIRVENGGYEPLGLNGNITQG